MCDVTLNKKQWSTLSSLFAKRGGSRKKKLSPEQIEAKRKSLAKARKNRWKTKRKRK